MSQVSKWPPGFGTTFGYRQMGTDVYYCVFCYGLLSVADRVECVPLIMAPRKKKCDTCRGDLYMLAATKD